MGQEMKPPGLCFAHWLYFGVIRRTLADRFAAVRDCRSRNNQKSLTRKRCARWSLFVAVAAIGPAIAAATSTAFAQAPPLGTVDTFAVLGGSTVTNTGPTVLSGTAALPGNLGVRPGSAITGFFAVDGGPGILTGPGASIHQHDAVAIQAQIDLTAAYNNLVGRPATVGL